MIELSEKKTDTDLVEKIVSLKEQKKAVILAHYYQFPEIQDIADYVGDSLELSQHAADTDAEIILFAGVHFMAETAKILNPTKKVLIPDLAAGCSLAESCTPKSFGRFKSKHPDHVVVTYINCSAEVKAMSDYICTSSNALKVIQTIPYEKSIIFAPDKNLGKYLNEVTGRNMLLWDGSCIVHEAFSIEKLLRLHRKHPNAEIIAHPESETAILNVANYIGSTSGMINYVKSSSSNEFIVGTEAGILYRMKKLVPNKTLIPAPSWEDNTCACSECAYMKVNTLSKLLMCLQKESPEVKVSPKILKKASIPINKMLQLA